MRYEFYCIIWYIFSLQFSSLIRCFKKMLGISRDFLHLVFSKPGTRKLFLSSRVMFSSVIVVVDSVFSQFNTYLLITAWWRHILTNSVSTLACDNCFPADNTPLPELSLVADVVTLTKHQVLSNSSTNSTVVDLWYETHTTLFTTRLRQQINYMCAQKSDTKP